MKTCIIFLISVFLHVPLFAQESPKPLVQEKMEAISWLAGNWKGQGWIMTRDGQRQEFEQTERIRLMLDNTILHIEGLGMQGADTIHNALAIVSFDAREEAYTFKSFTDKGGQTDAQVEVKPGTFTWIMNVPNQGQIRYTIQLNEKDQWFETGEFSRDQARSWTQFFEMTLDREEKIVAKE